MEINYNATSLIDILGFVQGLILGLILVIESKFSKPKLFLGFFLLTYSTELLNSIFQDLNILELKPNLLFLPLNFHFLTIPLFYIYVKKISNISLTKKKILYILFPGILEFLLYSFLFFLSVDTKLKISSSENFSFELFLFTVVLFPYSIYYAILTIKFINKQAESVENYYSNSEGKLLTWAKTVMIFMIIILSFIIFSLFLSNKFYTEFLYTFISSINVIFIFWVGISGIRQPKLFVSHNLTNKQKEIKNKLNKVSGNKPDISYIYEKLTELMVDEKLFLEPNLSLADVAIKLQIPQRNLSELIREKSGKNFNKFINHYRIEEAKKLLLDTSNNHLNMLGIAFDSGFSSKATFYSVFKKHTLQTPTSFKNNKLG